MGTIIRSCCKVGLKVWRLEIKVKIKLSRCVVGSCVIDFRVKVENNVKKCENNLEIRKRCVIFAMSKGD